MTTTVSADVLRAILEQVPSQVVVSDARLVVQWTNGPSEDSIGEERLSLLPADEQPRWREAFERAARTGAHQRIDTVGASKGNGSARTTTIAALPGDGTVTAYVDFTDDRADQIQAEQRLAQARAQLVEMSRRAGLAEVTTGALHNVGNVLNSVNVSTAAMVEYLDESRLGVLQRAIAMIGEHADHLGEFFTADPKGLELPSLLKMVTEQLVTEQERMRAELARLTQHVELMRATVEAQQVLAKVGESAEPVAIDELLDRVHSMFQIEMERRDIAYSATAEPIGEVVLDKQSTLQILANLVRNAIAAVESVDGERTLAVRVRADEQQVSFEVEDNGGGIAPDNIVKIFEHGFTTKPNGHGFGLHASATAAEGMRGSLVARSDGLGHGARFVLTIPRITP